MFFYFVINPFNILLLSRKSDKFEYKLRVLINKPRYI